MRPSIRFLRRGEIVEVAELSPTATLLDYLRLTERACGTKEGCGEGDCGACTVAIGSVRGGRLVYEPVNSCIQLLGMVDGKEVVAVDDLSRREGRLHPVQRAMVDAHASQCGFCTPGFVMALFALYHADAAPDRRRVNDWLAGNLCRCTGYRPIVAAGLEACAGRPSDSYAAAAGATAEALRGLADGEDVFIGDKTSFFAAPATVQGLAKLYARHKDAVLVAGATDVGLWITKQLRSLPKIIHLGRVAGLDAIADSGTELSIGATATYEMAEPHLAAIDPDLGELVRRLGAKQVRAAGTVGGNIANGSPIGDMPPALIALGATLELRRGGKTRTMKLEKFFVAYGKQDRRPGEFVSRVRVPKLRAGQVFRCYKIAKRFDQDISAVLGAFRFTLDGSRIRDCRIAYGGMAATPKRAEAAETALTGAELSSEATWRGALAALDNDFAPIDDMRASAAYRRATAKALLVKALHETAGAPTAGTRVVGQREAVLESVA
ncbi:MAG TPA: xanthine dehydrogenase small subunit [Dongiaceae bacterium]|nr:xanthine dehydrogenase small subunit [Dongiaceae bacterium]